MRFVLVHGSWQDGRCWSKVISALEKDGHVASALTLPGNGDLADPSATMAAAAEAVADHIRSAGAMDVVLVGHSFGGAVAQLAAQLVPEHLRRVVFYNAYVIEDGRSVFSYVPAAAAAAFGSLAAPDGTLALPYGWARDHLFNDAAGDVARAAFAEFCPEPLGRSGEELDLSRFAAAGLPASYIHATGDNVFGDAAFWHPGQSSHLADFRLVSIPGGHELMYSDPPALARALVLAGDD